MGLRQMLPVQTKRTLFTMNARASVREINLESNKAKSTRAEKNDEARMTNDEGMTNLE